MTPYGYIHLSTVDRCEGVLGDPRLNRRADEEGSRVHQVYTQPQRTGLQHERKAKGRAYGRSAGNILKNVYIFFAAY